MPPIVAGLIGNPNCGKTTLFNALTGGHQTIGNWPGVTVEKKSGTITGSAQSITVVDLPGLYSLGAADHMAQDERIARNFIQADHADLIVNIVDGANLERNLYLTCQLLEMGIPLIVAVNMMDMAKDRGISIDLAAMSQILGCPVIGLVASRKQGTDALKAAIRQLGGQPTHRPAMPPLSPALDQAIDCLARMVEPLLSARSGHPRWIATQLLEGDAGTHEMIGHCLDGCIAARRSEIETAHGEDADIIIADSRFSFVTRIMAHCIRRKRQASRPLSDRIDRIVLDRVLGIPIFMIVMYLMFMVTINVGGAFIDFFDLALAALLVEPLAAVLQSLHAPHWLETMLAQGIGGGIQTMATFVPVIGTLFLFLSFLEDSGYMARAAFVMDRAMRAIGLPGKSFVPLIVGFGCNVPAIMAARTLENQRDRVMTIMMAPFMSCGARLPVYAVFAAAFFPSGGQNVVFALYLIGVAFAIGTGLLLKHTLLKGDASPFIMELPPYHIPRPQTMIRRAKTRLGNFLFRAGKVIVPMVAILSFLNTWGVDGSFGNQNSDKSVLTAAGHRLVPLFQPMGMTDDNWPAAVGIVTGIFAKEAVIGTLNSLYGQLSDPRAGIKDDAPLSMGDKLMAAAGTIPENLSDLAQTVTDPLGLDISHQTLEVEDAALDAMISRFDGQVGAFSYLLLILLYMPCVAATGAINQEIGWRWTLFSAAWTTGLGYGASVLFYQATLLSTQPHAAGLRILTTLFALGIAAWIMRIIGEQQARRYLRDRSTQPAA